MRMNPMTRPQAGDVTMGTTTFHSTPLPSHQCLAEGWDQIITCQLLCAAANVRPHRPPTTAWLELEGMPNHPVIKFQTLAPNKAQIRISEVTTFTSTKPDAIVFATAVPHRAPIKLVDAAMMIACRGVNTLVETTVAMELAVS